MIALLIFFTASYWLWLQYRGGRPAKWARRKEAIAPIVRHVVWDVQALKPRKRSDEGTIEW